MKAVLGAGFLGQCEDHMTFQTLAHSFIHSLIIHSSSPFSPFHFHLSPRNCLSLPLPLQSYPSVDTVPGTQ